MSDFMGTMQVINGGLAAQQLRLHIGAENLANANSASGGPDGGPYRRQIINFRAEVDRATGLTKVVPETPRPDMTSPLNATYDPSNPLADAQGMVMVSNVDTLKESVDMREATRLYEANLQAFEATKSMAVRTLDMLR